MPDSNYGDTIHALDQLRLSAIHDQSRYRAPEDKSNLKTIEGQLARLQKYSGLAATHLTAVENQIKDRLKSPDDVDPQEMHDLAAKAAALKQTLGYFKSVGEEIGAKRSDFSSVKLAYPNAPVDAVRAEQLRKINPPPTPDPHVRETETELPGTLDLGAKLKYGKIILPGEGIGSAPTYENE
jgi:hypothetical protein